MLLVICFVIILYSLPETYSPNGLQAVNVATNEAGVTWSPFPVIGIMAQETDDLFYDRRKGSYIAASYVKFVESAGAVVVPIRMNQSREYYRKIFENINGLLLPGGEASITNSHYSKVSQMFFEWAIQEESGNFPIFGICLGFEQLLYMVANENKLTPCRGRDHASNITFTEAASKSRVVSAMPETLSKSLSESNITYNSHGWCLTEKDALKDEVLTDFFLMPAIGHDLDGIPFIAMIEAKDYPIFGTQWHPEKPQFEWRSAAIPHEEQAIKSGQFFANLFVSMARDNKHRMQAVNHDLLIYNYRPEYVINLSPFVQVYFFEDF